VEVFRQHLTNRSSQLAKHSELLSLRFVRPVKPVPLLVAFGMLILSSCDTKDFIVLDALHAGMSQKEARATIASFSFQRDKFLDRPSSGWASDQTSTDLPGRARAVEERLSKRIATVEYYPVHHGLFGFGLLFLFYDGEGRLVHFYRHQIN
jgi:hypothetical protein